MRYSDSSIDDGQSKRSIRGRSYTLLTCLLYQQPEYHDNNHVIGRQSTTMSPVVSTHSKGGSRVERFVLCSSTSCRRHNFKPEPTRLIDGMCNSLKNSFETGDINMKTLLHDEIALGIIDHIHSIFR